MKYLISTISLSLLLGACSVKKAGAPSAPPETENKIFNAAELSGAFCQKDRPKMFLWPTEKDGVEMTYSEKADSRQKINHYNDIANENIEIRDLNQETLDLKYLPLIKASEAEFTSMKCYSYCDPMVSFLCDPSDDTVTSIGEGEWIEGADDEEKEQIALCQKNQGDRDVVNQEYKEKVALEVTPFNDKAGEASSIILQEIGENYLDMPDLQYTYIDGHLVVQFTLDDQLFSTESEDPLFKITEARMNLIEGYLSFNANALDVEEDNRIKGLYKFDLEFISSGPTKRLDGDFIYVNHTDNSERVGRIASSGYVSKTGLCD